MFYYKSSKNTKSYKGYIPIRRTLGEPTFKEKWKAWRSGNPPEFLSYTELQELVRYAYSKNLSTTLSELEVLLFEAGINTLQDAINYINANESKFGKIIINEDYVPEDNNGGTNKGCCNCKCRSK